MKVLGSQVTRLFETTFVTKIQIVFLCVALCFLSGRAVAAPMMKNAWLAATETTSGSNINAAAGVALKWSSATFDDTYFDHSLVSSPERLIIKNAGDYLVAVTVPMMGSVTRAAVQAEVWVNGSPATGTIGESSYIRNGSGHNESSNHIAVFLNDLAVDDYVEIYVKRTASPGTVNISGQASLYAEYIDAGRSVFSATATQTVDSINLNQTTPHGLQWAEVRKDGGFSHSDSLNPENITLEESGDYLVLVNVPLTGNVTRGNVRVLVQDDGVTVPGGEGKQGYIRNASGHTDSSIHWSGLIYNVEAGSVLSIKTEQEAATGAILVPAGKSASLYVEKIDSAKHVFFARGMTLTGGDNWNPPTAQPIQWQNDDIIDADMFAHSTESDSHQISVNNNGDYLLIYNDSLTSSGARANPKITVEVNGTPRTGAETKSHYIRSASGHSESSGTLVYLLRELAAGDVITVSAVKEAAGSTVDDNQEALLVLWFKGDAVAPALASAEVNYQSLILNYTEINGLDTESTPETTDFTIGTDGAAQTVTDVVVSDNELTLTLFPGVANADVITVSYTAGTNPIQDKAANAAADLVDQTVTNNTAKLVFVTQPGGASLDSNLDPQPVVEIQDGAGVPIVADPDDAFVETVTVAFTAGSNEEGAVLSGTLTSPIDWSSGRATFSDLSVNLLGSYQLKASTNVVPSTIDSAAFNVTAGPPTQLVFNVEPSNAVSSNSISPAIEVHVLDSDANLVTTATDSIAIAISDNPAGGALWGSLTVQAVNGVATFSDISIDKAGSGYTLDAMAPGLSTDTSTSFDIAAGPATKLVYSVEPGNSVSTKSITPAIRVQAQDDGGNLVSAMTGAVTLALNHNPGSATLSGTVTVSAEGGVAVFTDIAIDKVGSGYTLDATSSGLSSATSAGFDVMAGSPTQLVYRVEPTNAVATQWISPAIKVQLLDEGGNLAGSATDPVTLAIDQNPGNGTLSGTLTVSAQAGEATFSEVAIDKRGDGYRLMADASGMISAVSEPFNVVASDEAIQLGFSVQPVDSVSMTAISPAVKVQVLDAGGNLVDSARHSISLGIHTKPSDGTLGGSLTAQAVNGEATFDNLTIDRADSGYRLVASAAGLTSGVSSEFDITTGPATQLGFVSQPTSAAVGAPLAPSVKVQVQDAGGNHVPNAANLVTLGIGSNPSGSILTGTSTVSAVTGEAVFDDVSIGKIGSGYTLVAYSSGLISAASSSFDVTVGGPSKLVFSVEPSNGTTLSPISPDIKVQVQDAGGNLVTTATTAITLGFDYNAGSANLSGTFTVNAVGGEASFADISLDKSGIGYSLLANAPGLASGRSVAFDVIADGPSSGGGSLAVMLPINQPTVESVTVIPTGQYELNESQPVSSKPAEFSANRMQNPVIHHDVVTDSSLRRVFQPTPVREHDESGLLNREKVIAGSSVTIRYRAPSGLAPEIDVYDPQHNRRVTAARMKEVGSSGVYEYQLALNPEWDSGDFTVIASETTKGTLDWMTMTVAVTDGADVNLVNSQDRISVSALLAAVQSKLDSLESNLSKAREELKQDDETVVETPNQVPGQPEIDRIHQSIREISQLLEPVSEGNGVNLESLHESINEDSTDIQELEEKAKRLKILLDLNRELTEKPQKDSRAPVTKTWYETGSVILKILVVNPSQTETQTVPVKVYLPKEVSPEDILDLEDLKLDYDTDKNSYYAYNQVELGPGESIVKRVRMEDIWVVPEAELSTYLGQAKQLVAELEASPYAEEGAAFYLAVDSKVQEILETQKKTKSDPAKHIEAYRNSTSLIASIKKDLSALERYLVRARETTDESNKEAAQSPQEPIKESRNTPSRDEDTDLDD